MPRKFDYLSSSLLGPGPRRVESSRAGLGRPGASRRTDSLRAVFAPVLWLIDPLEQTGHCQRSA